MRRIYMILKILNCFTYIKGPRKSLGLRGCQRRLASTRFHLDTLLSRSGSSHFAPRYTFPKPWQICFHMASFGHLSVQIRIRPLSRPGAPSQSQGRCASIWLHLNTFLSRSGSMQFRSQVHPPKAKRIWVDRRRARAPLGT